MTFILRWPAILVLFAVVLFCLLGVAAASAALTGFDIAGPAVVEEAQVAATGAGAAQVSWLEVGLWGGAALFFLISAIRLMRRTQAFWTWLLGFACFGGRWAYVQGSDAVAQISNLDYNIYMQPQRLIADTGSTEAQLAILGVVLVVGILILIVDGADRAYWERQAA